MRKKILITALTLFPLSMNAQVFNDTTVVSDCFQYEWRGKSYTQTGIYYDTVFAEIVFNEVFGFTGADQSYTVPAGVTELYVALKGAGGGSGSDSYDLANGGSGALVKGKLNVLAGSVLTIVVGEGGKSGLVGTIASPNYGGGTPSIYINNGYYGGVGGGMSAIKLNSQYLVAAGGAGGAGTVGYVMTDGENGGLGTGSDYFGTGGGYLVVGSGGASYVSDPSFIAIANIPGGANNAGVTTGYDDMQNAHGGNGEVIISSIDLVYILDLTIVEIDTTIHILNNVLTSNQNDATYQWIKCSNDANTPIADATNQSYTITESGSYAVEVSYNGCVNTSSCKVVNMVGVNEEVLHSSISVFPNPTADVVNFSELVNVQISTITGQIVINKENVSLVDLSNQVSGVYFITLTNDKGQIIQRNKIVKL